MARARTNSYTYACAVGAELLGHQFVVLADLLILSCNTTAAHKFCTALSATAFLSWGLYAKIVVFKRLEMGNILDSCLFDHKLSTYLVVFLLSFFAFILNYE